MQRIEIIGLVGKDAEVKDVGNNQVINFSVAVTEKRNDQEYTTWYDIAKWGNNVAVAPHIKKGGKIFIAGKPTCRAYVNNSNEAVAVLGINAFEIELLSFPADNQQTPQQQRQPYNVAGDQFLNLPNSADDKDDLPF